jgi:hypothetical protein
VGHDAQHVFERFPKPTPDANGDLSQGLINGDAVAPTGAG